jgi:hypothetical protein
VRGKSREGLPLDLCEFMERRHREHGMIRDREEDERGSAARRYVEQPSDRRDDIDE